jgi:polysaccharide export outer membrane protein
LLYALILSTSCGSSKNLIILNDLPDSPRIALPQLASPLVTIQPDDILEIKISGKFVETVNDFNLKGGGYTSSALATPNYLVDKDGNIEIYKIGKVKASGYTIDSLKHKLTDLVDPHLKDASIVIRFISFRFTVLGEVKQQGTYTVPNEKVSILEALGYAGDMTQFAKRRKVRVIRDSSGFREIGLVNFNQKTLFTSPYYYLRRNDVVLVESEIETKRANETLAKTSSIIGILTSVVTLLYLLLKK